MFRFLVALAMFVSSLAPLRGQILRPILMGKPAASGGTPGLIARKCQNLGMTGGTTAALNTTGADFIMVIPNYDGTALIGTVTITVTENKGNGAPSQLTSYVGTLSAIQMVYWTNPTVGSGHTFTVASSGNYFGSVCVEAWNGMATMSVFDTGTDKGIHTDNNACQTASITPSSGVKVVIAGLTYNDVVSPSASIDSSFTVDDQVDGDSGVAIGGAVASLLQTPNGATTQPAWAIGGSSNITACAIAAFKGM